MTTTSFSTILLIGGAVAALALAAASATAQEAAEQGATSSAAAPQTATDAPVDGDIVVTANRRRQRLQDVPISVTAETGDMLAQRGAHELEDIVRSTPGLSNAGSGAGTRTNLTVRGVSTGTDFGLKQATVSLLLDDIATDPSAVGLATTNLKVVDIERVEVLRGPQGTLFGSGSLSGAVRYVTNKPDFGRVERSAEITGVTTRHGDGSVWGNAAINVPLVTEKLAIRAVGYGYDEGGWIDNIRTGENRINRSTSYGGRVAVAAKPSDRLSLSFTAIYQNDSDHALGESLYTAPAGVADADLVTDLRRSTRIDVKSTILNVGATYDLGGVSLLSSSTYLHREADSYDDLGHFNEYAGLLFSIPGLNGPAPSHTVNDQHAYTQELRLSSNGNGALRWTLGGFFQRTDSDGGQLITSAVLLPLIGTDVLGRLDSRGSQQEFAAFGEATYRFAPRWDLTLGARVSRNSVAFTTASSGLVFTGLPSPAVAVATDINRKETAFTPRLAIAYKPSADLTFYAQASRGYRVGGPNLTAGLGGSGIPTAYASDSLWNYEVGTKGRWLDGRIQLDADLYYIDWSNLQTSLVVNAVNYTGNAGSARILGLEAALRLRPVDGLELGGTVSANSAELTSDVPNLTRSTGATGVRSGEDLPASTAVQLGGWAQADFQALGHGAFVRGSVQYVGPEYSDFGKQGTRFGDFATADVRVGIDIRSVKLALFVNNLFDSDGKRGGYDASYLGPVTVRPQLAFRVRPRTGGITVSTHF